MLLDLMFVLFIKIILEGDKYSIGGYSFGYLYNLVCGKFVFLVFD